MQRYYINNINQSDFQNQLIDDFEITLLGSKKKEIHDEILRKMDAITDKSGIEHWRTPLKVISGTATSDRYETIGGGTQLNIANRHGCEPYYASREKSSGSRFRNIDIHEDIGDKVGQCFISIGGMDYKMQDVLSELPKNI